MEGAGRLTKHRRDKHKEREGEREREGESIKGTEMSKPGEKKDNEHFRFVFLGTFLGSLYHLGRILWFPV